MKHARIDVSALGIREGAKPSREQRLLRVPVAAGPRAFLSVLQPRSLVFVCTQDRLIAPAAAQLAEIPNAAQHAYAHSCATQGPLLLEALHKLGAKTAAFHILQSFGPSPFAWQRIEGSFCAIEAAGKLKQVLYAVARAIGVSPFDIRGNQRAAYHAAAVLASNALVTLLETGERILRGAKFSSAAAARMLLPLVRGSIESVALLGPAQALTGPVVRGDAQTVAAHIEALTGEERGLYRTIMKAALELALRSERLKPRDADSLKKLLG